MSNDRFAGSLDSRAIEVCGIISSGEAIRQVCSFSDETRVSEIKRVWGLLQSNISNMILNTHVLVEIMNLSSNL